MVNSRSKPQDIKISILDTLKRQLGLTMETATPDDVYRAAGITLREEIMERWAVSTVDVDKQKKKRLYYMSAEFLMGRALVNNMVNLSLLDGYKEALELLGYTLEDIEEQEADPGLGNGGLGRLAACFLDAISTLDLPVTGCSIRYEHGLFKQKIVDGRQVEEDDNWLEKGNIWEIPRPDQKVEVRYGGYVEESWGPDGLSVEHKDYNSIDAIPYDYPVLGYNSNVPATLRLWSARAKNELDMNYFNKGEYAKAAEESALVESVSQILYPEDNHEEGRKLRLKQFYFFSSASMQYMVRRHKKVNGDIRTLPDHYVVQINDTHPTVSIPELIRILMDEEHLTWDEAWDIATRVFNYTNHTILAEALEKWDESLFKQLLPRIYKIILTINQKFTDQIWKKWPGDIDKLNELAIVHNGQIRMANLCIAVCAKVNGVSTLHGEIIKKETFKNFYVMYPDKFLGITNGITHRRWLAKCNQPLTNLIESYIGDKFLKDYTQLEKLKVVVEKKPAFIKSFAEVKKQNKILLAEHLEKTQGISINPDTIFDVQAKRLHEYKRQLLKVMHIIHLYHRIKDNPQGHGVTPTTFMFAAKAAPGYYMAKEIIRLILALSRLVEMDHDARDVIKIVFIENYNVSEAEILIPATEISNQISTAGLEASGTGNMKFMLNGALTIGTLDGANVEMSEAAGLDNIFIFGATVNEIDDLRNSGNYYPRGIYENNNDIKRILDTLINETLPVSADKRFYDIFHSLLDGMGQPADRYFLLHDFPMYDAVYTKMMETYADQAKWNKMAAWNTATAGIFCADRTISDYNDLVWHL
ncbi:MAG: glycogen/starch/alpha-glucan phosphorylase [Clostridiales Family XIII bacterium]|nr:glycogen/starch/alpha-glucan phosphorylase [Clostridiales Family XIII bacterium]